MFYSTTGKIEYFTPLKQIEPFTDNNEIQQINNSKQPEDAQYVIRLLNNKLQEIIRPNIELIRELQKDIQKNQLDILRQKELRQFVKNKEMEYNQNMQYNQLMLQKQILQQKEQVLQKTVQEQQLSEFNIQLAEQIKNPSLVGEEQEIILIYLKTNISSIEKIFQMRLMQEQQRSMQQQSMQQRSMQQQSMQQQRSMQQQSMQQQRSMQRNLLQSLNKSVEQQNKSIQYLNNISSNKASPKQQNLIVSLNMASAQQQNLIASLNMASKQTKL